MIMFPENKNQRQRVLRILTMVNIGLILLAYGFIGIIYLRPVMGSAFNNPPVSPNHAGLLLKSSTGNIRLNPLASRHILRHGIAFLERYSGTADHVTWFKVDWPGFFWRLAGNINNSSPLGLLQTQFPLAAIYESKPVPPKPAVPPEDPPGKPEIIPSDPPTDIIKFSDAPAVLIYHTHTTESYIPVSGKAHLPNSQGDIVKVGAYLQKKLADQYQIKSLHNETIHDVYPFRDAYQRSRDTMRKYLSEYPGLKVLLDIHRNAAPGWESSCVIHGLKSAKMMIVVGSNKMGLPHPAWRENLLFAQQLNKTLNQLYPGLCNGIVISDARYNQQLSHQALIIEFGDQNSTLAEVYHTVDFFAESLSKVISQENPSKP